MGHSTLKIKGAGFQLHRVTHQKEKIRIRDALSKLESRLLLMQVEHVEEYRVDKLLNRIRKIKRLLSA
jgi:hypothetical protein